MMTHRTKPKVYLDYNATTPPSDLVLGRVAEWLSAWGNPSSIHWSGRQAKAILSQARQSVAGALGVHPLELIYTSGGSEANNLALKGVFHRNPKGRFLVSSVEHPSVTKTIKSIEKLGASVEHISVSRSGLVDLERYEALLNDSTKGAVGLVSTMLVNNETGAIFPVKKMAKMAHQVGALFHTDAVQGLGKIPLNLAHLGVDLATFSGHKFYALKGVGVLFCKRGVLIETMIHGGGQERFRRGGTENLLAIASLGVMCEQVSQISEQSTRIRQMREDLERQILSSIPRCSVTNSEAKRAPGTLSVVIDGVDGETLLMNLDMAGFAVSTGAACSSGRSEPSPTLLAMGLSRREAQGSLRVSLGWQTTVEEVQSFFSSLKVVVDRLRGLEKERLEQVDHV